MQQTVSADQRIIIDIVCNAIDRLMDLESDQGSDDCVTRFHGSNMPSISVKSYIARFAKYSPFPSACLLTLLAYLDRIKSSCPGIAVNPLSIHRLVMSALILSIKFHCDHIYSNRYYAKVGGVSAAELMRLEFDMLAMLNYRITIDKYELDMYKHHAFALVMPSAIMSSRAPKLNISQSMPVSPTPSRSSTPAPMMIDRPDFINAADKSKAADNAMYLTPSVDMMHTNKHMHFVTLHTPVPVRSQRQPNTSKMISNSFTPNQHILSNNETSKTAISQGRHSHVEYEHRRNRSVEFFDR